MFSQSVATSAIAGAVGQIDRKLLLDGRELERLDRRQPVKVARAARAAPAPSRPAPACGRPAAGSTSRGPRKSSATLAPIPAPTTHSLLRLSWPASFCCDQEAADRLQVVQHHVLKILELKWLASSSTDAVVVERRLALAVAAEVDGHDGPRRRSAAPAAAPRPAPAAGCAASPASGSKTARVSLKSCSRITGTACWPALDWGNR